MLGSTADEGELGWSTRSWDGQQSPSGTPNRDWLEPGLQSRRSPWSGNMGFSGCWRQSCRAVALMMPLHVWRLLRSQRLVAWAVITRVLLIRKCCWRWGFWRRGALHVKEIEWVVWHSYCLTFDPVKNVCFRLNTLKTLHFSKRLKTTCKTSKTTF